MLLGLRQDFVTIIIIIRRRTFLKRLSGNDLGAWQSEKTRIKINIDLKKLNLNKAHIESNKIFLMTKSKCLKRLRFSYERMSSGSLFQSSGAETENALDP